MKSVLFFTLFFIFSCKTDPINKGTNSFDVTDNIKQKINSSKADNLFNEGLELSSFGKYDEAKNKIESAYLIEKSPIFLNELGVIARSNKDYDLASEKFEEANKLDSLYWPSYINKSYNLMLLKEYESSKITLNDLKSRTSSVYWDSYADYYLAIIYFNHDGDCIKAKEFLHKSSLLATDPILGEEYSRASLQIKSNCK